MFGMVFAPFIIKSNDKVIKIKKMKKGITIFGLIAVLTFSSFAFTTPKNDDKEKETVGIAFFDGTWEEALALAKKENKLIFLDAYAVWCGPCKILSKRVFVDPEVGEYFNAHFINFKMDMEKNENGPRLSRKYGLKAYPTLYFIKSNENINNQSVGLLNAKQLKALGQTTTEMLN